MPITNVQKTHLNKMNRASQDVLLGNIIDNLTSGSGSILIQSGSFGGNGGYTYFESDGTLRLSGSAIVWDDLVVPLTQARLGANSKPDFDFTNVGYRFPQNDTTEILYFIVQMPHRWKDGGNIEPHVHWEQSQNNNVIYKMDYKWFNAGSLIPANFTTYIMNQPVFSYTSGSLHQISSGSASINGVGKTLSSILLIKLYRDDDVYVGDALTFQFDIHYEIDSLGSSEEFIK